MKETLSLFVGDSTRLFSDTPKNESARRPTMTQMMRRTMFISILAL